MCVFQGFWNIHYILPPTTFPHSKAFMFFFFLPFPWCRIGGWFDTTDISIVKFAHGSNSCESTFLSVIMRKDPEKKFYLSRFYITISTCCFWNLHKCKSIRLLILSINNARICQKEETDIKKKKWRKKDWQTRTDNQQAPRSQGKLWCLWQGASFHPWGYEGPLCSPSVILKCGREKKN